MELKDIVVSPATTVLLRTNGNADRIAGIPIQTGWEEIRKACGFSSGRTPAREAYEDGYYGAK